MKKILLSLIATLCALSSHAQTIEVFKNGQSIATYSNTPNEHYVVKFYSTGDYEHINGHEYVIIGGLKWATMNVGATTVAESNATAFGDFYAWGEVDTYYKTYDDKNALWKDSNLTYIKGKKDGYNWVNYCTGDPKNNNFKEWDPVPYDNYQLTADYDVAHKEWGGTWRIPTMDELIKLYEACVDKSHSSIGTGTGTASLKTLPEDGRIIKGGIYRVPQNSTVDGYPYNVAGVLFVMMDDTNQRLFFPAAGNIQGKTQDQTRNGVGTLCSYWSANVWNTSPGYALPLYIGNAGINMNQKLPRCYGFSIRPVSD